MLTERRQTGKGWKLDGRRLIGETYHCTFIAAVCTLRPSVPTILTRFDTVTLAAVATISATLSMGTDLPRTAKFNSRKAIYDNLKIIRRRNCDVIT